jgi:Ca2+-binding RTX toxin-like protein
VGGGGGGKDLVISSVDFVLGTKVEHLTLTGTAINGTGNGSKNKITGNDQNNNLDGDAKKDTLTGKTGDDVLTGGAGDDTLNGGGGEDIAIGGTGADTINGGSHKDTMTGGANGDSFVFDAVSDSGNTNATADIITDFVEGGQDWIDLSGIDAVTGGGDDGFAFIGGAAFSNTAGELRTYTDGGDTYVAGDVNGDGLSDFVIRLNGSHSLVGSDFDL